MRLDTELVNLLKITVTYSQTVSRIGQMFRTEIVRVIKIDILRSRNGLSIYQDTNVNYF